MHQRIKNISDKRTNHHVIVTVSSPVSDGIEVDNLISCEKSITKDSFDEEYHASPTVVNLIKLDEVNERFLDTVLIWNSHVPECSIAPGKKLINL